MAMREKRSCMADGSFKGGVYSGTLANDGVSIAPYHDNAAMIILAGVVGRVRPPAAEGIPYEKQ